ncbi:MAG: hypothetical protein QF415_04610 [Candidatus Undinarchaeales archaeon]|jgi:hypothetical protein|nr:hypothetical protein [Candidatus Undinarchaeales archaeon]MDP7493090.1 hypothetical protein [Candidatus Undinarchaeales archaeon]
MERAIIVARVALLDTIDWTGHDRLYLGNGYCQRLMPTRTELTGALKRADDAGVAVTFVTPPVTQDGIARLKPLLAELPDGTEIVANDWGVIDVVAEEGRLEPVVGGIIHKQKRGPRLMLAKEALTTEAWERFRTTNMDVPVVRSLLASRGVRRVEVENPFQGVSLRLGEGKNPFHGSFHHPYVFVTISRYCLVGLASTRPGRPEWGVFPCTQACKDSLFRLDHPTMGVPLYLKGCAVFAKNDALPSEDELVHMGIDRMVESPQVPV